MFIVFEGIDGSGKSTQSSLLYNDLRKMGYNVVLTREPGGTLIAEKIRDVILFSDALMPKCEVMLFLAARYDHYLRFIRPALLLRNIVICDRFIASTIAYQTVSLSAANEQSLLVNIDFIVGLHSFVFGDFFSKDNILVADHTFFLDVSLEHAMKRMKKNDNIENRGKDYYNNVINNYRKLKDITKNYHIIDAEASKKDVASMIFENLSVDLEKIKK